MTYLAIAFSSVIVAFGPQAQSSRLSAYLDLAQATLANPIDHEELRTLVLSEPGVEAIRGLFESTVDDAVELDGAWISPELGGEAMVDAGHVSFVPYPDPLHPIVREMLALRDDPAGMLAYLRGSVLGQRLLETTGGLHALLYQLSEESPTPERLGVLGDVLRNAVATHFKTWTTDPAIQAEHIESTDWRGRYLGFWHLHPPRRNAQGFLEGIEPSVADMRNAVELGQFLTIVFQPGGFDVYDLAPLARAGEIDRSRMLVIQYRDPAWRQRFEERVGATRPVRAP